MVSSFNSLVVFVVYSWSLLAGERIRIKKNMRCKNMVTEYNMYSEWIKYNFDRIFDPNYNKRLIQHNPTGITLKE